MIKGKVSNETTGKILDRLAKDRDFREHFLGDPADALRQFGIEVDAAKVPAVRKLPPIDRIVEMRKQLGADSKIEKVGLIILLLK